MVEESYELVVVGAGLAGFAAALAASRSGMRVLLLEGGGGPGGVAVDGGCPSLMGFSSSGRQIVGGIGDELIRRLDARGMARFIEAETGVPGDERIGVKPLDKVVISDSHYLRCELDAMLEEAGVACRYYSWFTGLDRDGERIVRLHAISSSGERTAFHTGMVIDATGTAAVAMAAGVECMEPDAEDAMTKTLMFRVAPVSDFNKRAVRDRFTELSAAGKVPFKGQDRFMGSATLNHGEVLVNLTLVSGQALDAADLTRMDKELRIQVSEAVDWLRREFREFRDCRLVAAAPRIGVRIYRTVRGMDIIRCADLERQTPVCDGVALAPVAYGGHGLNSFSNDWDLARPGVRAIPMGCLVARGVDNLLLAGRIISVEPRAVSSIRMMGTSMATGHAAGVVAARGGSGAVYSDVRDKLLKQNAILA